MGRLHRLRHLTTLPRLDDFWAARCLYRPLVRWRRCSTISPSFTGPNLGISSAYNNDVEKQFQSSGSPSPPTEFPTIRSGPSEVPNDTIVLPRVRFSLYSKLDPPTQAHYGGTIKRATTMGLCRCRFYRCCDSQRPGISAGYVRHYLECFSTEQS